MNKVLICMNYDNLRITGEVTAKGHQNWVELEFTDYDKALKRSMNHKNQSGEILISKRRDKASAKLFAESAHQQTVPSVKIHYVVQGSADPYMSFVLYKVTTYDFMFDKIKESLTLHYGDIKFTFAKST